MTSEPPKPPSQDTIKKTTEELAKFAQWIAELIYRRNWFTLLLLVDAILILFFTPGGVVAESLKGLFSLENLPKWYGTCFWLTVGVVFVAAIVVAVRTMPPEVEEDKFKEHKAIKGLRPFTVGDADIFSRLQRHNDLEDCLNALESPSFRFGYLVGESGCGKTSFLQAGLLPKLEENINKCGVYIRFSNQEPLATICQELVKQFYLEELSADINGDEGFLPLVEAAVEVADKPLILLFDQFEQFFVQCKYPEDRQPFMQALQEWYNSAPKSSVKIVFSIRADLYYHLIEIEKALGYSPSPFEVCHLKKFSPQQATEVLGFIAETEDFKFDRSFIQKVTQQEIASREDGLISPVDLQILAWMLERENIEGLRAFNEKAFQKLGGIEGLLRRYLEKVLNTRTAANQRQATIRVLLALTDLEQRVRGGVLTVEELQAKLKDSLKGKEVEEAAVWLARGDVRLISPVEREEVTGYELAHERMIPALMQLSGKELTEAEQANKLLDTRVNEWLASNGKSRYLFDPAELWLIERQKPYLIWGTKREQKERLIRKSKQLVYGITSLIAVVLLILALFSGWLSYVPAGQMQRVRWAITSPWGSPLARVSDGTATQASLALAKEGKWQLAFKLVKEYVDCPFDQGNFLSQFATVALQQEDSDQAKVQRTSPGFPILEASERIANKVQVGEEWREQRRYGVAQTTCQNFSSILIYLYLMKFFHAPSSHGKA
ncbi:MAG: AAA family ATPase [Coleofasciculaceae cyanobacterium]